MYVCKMETNVILIGFCQHQEEESIFEDAADPKKKWAIKYQTVPII